MDHLIDEDMRDRAAAVLDAARAAGVMIVTAESCTGGLVAATLTAISGSSDVVEGGFVTYSNVAKVRLGVPSALVTEHGAVSEEVARALAEAAAARAGHGSTRKMVAVSVTGVAGPGGGSAEKPVGLVHFGTAGPNGTSHRRVEFGALGRDQVRSASVMVALEMLSETIRMPTAQQLT